MAPFARRLFPFAVASLFVGAAACGKDTASPGSSLRAGQAPLVITLASVSSSGSGLPVSGIMAGDNGGPPSLGDFGDGEGHHWHGWWGWMRTHDVDSLTVTVTKLEVLTALADSENAADSAADSTAADSAHGAHGDNDNHDWEQREFGWTVIPVDSAHLDLIHLPDSAAAGVKIATGTLPAGTYRHVRLFIVNPTIYFDSTIVTPQGDTLMAHTPYPVTFPGADSTGATFKTDDPFTVPAAGDTVSLFFDRDDTVRHIIITGDGKIVVLPSFHQRHRF